MTTRWSDASISDPGAIGQDTPVKKGHVPVLMLSSDRYIFRACGEPAILRPEALPRTSSFIATIRSRTLITFLMCEDVVPSSPWLSRDSGGLLHCLPLHRPTCFASWIMIAETVIDATAPSRWTAVLLLPTVETIFFSVPVVFSVFGALPGTDHHVDIQLTHSWTWRSADMLHNCRLHDKLPARVG